MTMNKAKRWLLAFGIAAAGVIGGAGEAAAITIDETVATGSMIASHEEDDESADKSGKKEGNKDEDRTKDEEGKSGDSSDKADDDASDVGDTDGPGDDEDD
jgi:hypothetical protein